MRWIFVVVLLMCTSARAQDVTVVLGGDVALPTGPNDAALDALGPKVFDEVAPYLRRADLAFANLEAPLTSRPPVLKKAFPLTMPPARLAWLAAAGLDVLSLANNHMGDAGRDGVADTLAALDAQPWLYTGAHTDPSKADDGVVAEVRGVRIGFLAFGNGSAAEVAHFGDVRAVRARVVELRARCDVLVVSVHGGTEYRHASEPALTRLYHTLVDAGADVVVGTHPHVIRGLERYRQSLILHGVGNLAFGSITDRHRKRGATLWGMLPIVHIVDRRVDRLEIVPLWVDNGYPLGHGEALAPAAALQPRVLTGAAAVAMLDALARLTQATDPTLRIVRKGDVGVVYLYGPPP